MYERFTENALQDLLHAQEEAKLDFQNFVGTAHILLGIIKNQNSMVGWVLRKKFTLEKARIEVLNLVGKGSGFLYFVNELPIGGESERILNNANAISKYQGFDIFDSEDILYGILSDKNCDGYKVLEALKVDINILFDEINKIKSKKYPTSNKKYQKGEENSFKKYKGNEYFYDNDYFNSKKNYNSDQFEDSDDDQNFSTSKDEDLISKLLKIGINNKTQLEKNDIFYWWQIKYLEIQKNQDENTNESLIELNSIREELENIEKNLLVNTLKNNKNSNTFENPKEENKKNNKSSKKKNGKSASLWKVEGDFLKEEKFDFLMAIEFYSEALKIDETYYDAFINRALCKKELGNYQDALLDLEKAIKLEPSNIDGYFYKGEVKRLLNELNEAYDCWLNASNLNPKTNKNYLLKGKASIKIGRLSVANDLFTELLKQLPNNQEALFERGKVQFTLKNYQGAVDDFSRNIEFDSNDSEALFLRGRARFKLMEKFGAYNLKDLSNNKKTNNFISKNPYFLNTYRDYSKAYKINPLKNDKNLMDEFQILTSIKKEEEENNRSRKNKQKENTSRNFKKEEKEQETSKNIKQYLRDKFNWIIKNEGIKINEYSFNDSVILEEQIIIRNSKGENLVTYWRDYQTREWYKKNFTNTSKPNKKTRNNKNGETIKKIGKLPEPWTNAEGTFLHIIALFHKISLFGHLTSYFQVGSGYYWVSLWLTFSLGFIAIERKQKMCRDYGVLISSNQFEESLKGFTPLLLVNLLISTLFLFTEEGKVYCLISFSLFLGSCIHLRDILTNGDQAFFGSGNPDYE